MNDNGWKNVKYFADGKAINLSSGEHYPDDYSVPTLTEGFEPCLGSSYYLHVPLKNQQFSACSAGYTKVSPPSYNVTYKFSEDRILKEIEDYISGTYKEHYSGNNGTQAFELIESAGHGESFLIGNIIKYAARYGRKGGKNRKDLIKIIHYSIMTLHLLDKTENNKE